MITAKSLHIDNIYIWICIDTLRIHEVKRWLQRTRQTFVDILSLLLFHRFGRTLPFFLLARAWPYFYTDQSLGGGNRCAMCYALRAFSAAFPASLLTTALCAWATYRYLHEKLPLNESFFFPVWQIGIAYLPASLFSKSHLSYYFILFFFLAFSRRARFSAIPTVRYTETAVHTVVICLH